MAQGDPCAQCQSELLLPLPGYILFRATKSSDVSAILESSVWIETVRNVFHSHSIFFCSTVSLTSSSSADIQVIVLSHTWVMRPIIYSSGDSVTFRRKVMTTAAELRSVSIKNEWQRTLASTPSLVFRYRKRDRKGCI